MSESAFSDVRRRRIFRAAAGVTGDLRQAIKSRLARTAYMYLFSYAVSLGIPFVLLPVFTFYIDPESYGHFATFQVLLSTLAGIAGLSFQIPLVKVFSGQDHDYQARFLSSSIILMGCTSAVVTMPLLLARHAVGDLTQLSFRWVIVAAAAAFAFVVNQASFTVLQARQRSAPYVFAQILFSILNAIISIFLVIGLKSGWSGRAAAAALVALISGSWGLLRFFEEGLLRRPSRADLKNALQLGGMAAPWSIAALLSVNVDRIVLRLFFTFQDLGIYSVAAQFAFGFGALCDAVNIAVLPWAYRRLSDVDSGADFRPLARNFLVLAAALALFAAAFLTAIEIYARLAVSRQYAGIFIFLPWLVSAALFQSLFTALSVVLFHYRKSAILSFFAVASLGASILFVYLFSALLGPIGAAIGLFVARLLMLAMLIIVGAFVLMSQRAADTHKPLSTA